MKAARISEYGGPEIIKVVEIDKPVVKEGQVLVEVHAASLNPFDTSVRAGFMKEFIPLELPVTIGGDIAGVVKEVGPGVEGWQAGDEVYGQASVVAGNSGAFAEFAATKQSQVAMKPKNTDFIEAASLPLVGVSAWQAITAHAGLEPGQKLFIHGGSGGIGSIAIQIARNIGAYVAVTATGDKLGYVKEIGADEVIDYKEQDFSEILKDYDVVFDTTPGQDLGKAMSILKRGGILISMLAEPDAGKAEELGVTAILQGTKVTTEALNELARLVDSGVVKPNVGKVFKLEDVQAAFEAREQGSVKGKVILEIKK